MMIKKEGPPQKKGIRKETKHTHIHTHAHNKKRRGGEEEEKDAVDELQAVAWT